MKLYKLVFKLAILSRWTLLWSKFYRNTFQRKYNKKNSPLILKRNISTESDENYFKRVYESVKGIDWKKDDWKQMWDVISTPHFMQTQINRLSDNKLQEEKSCDCDDYSVYFANIISKKFSPQLLTVTYKEPDAFVFGGHVVCLVKDSNDEYYHISNWGIYGGFKTTEEVVENIVGDRLHVGSVLYTKDLNLFNVKFVDSVNK